MLSPGRVGLTAAGLVLAAAPARAQADTVPAAYRAAVGYTLDYFRGDTDPWHLAAVEVSRRSARGTVLARGTFASRFSRTGEQVEVEAYPRLTGRTYGFVGAGWSPGELFPRFRAGAELFGTPSRGWELSAGARYLDFQTTRVTLLTGSVGAYPRNYYLAARPFLAFSSTDDRGTLSGSLLARRYLRTEEEYLTLRVSGGSTPPEQFTATELGRTGAFQVGIDGKTPVGERVSLTGLLGRQWEDLPGGRERRRFVVGVGAEARF